MPRRPLRPARLAALALALVAGLAPASALAGPAGPAVAPTSRIAGEPDSVPAPGWALVLSGGAARGLAEIGALRVLDQEGVRPDLVVGTSMGAIVGALYASGLDADEIAARVRHIDWQALFDPGARTSYEWRGVRVPAPWLKLVSRGRGFRLPSALLDESALDHELVLQLADAEVLAQGDFDRLPIPLRVVAADVATTGPVVLRRGSVARAVRASSSIVFAFPPVKQDGALLVDGGLASNLPVGTARAEGVDHVLAVDVSYAPPVLTEHSSALTLALALFDKVNRRGQSDTLTAADRCARLPLPGYTAADFPLADSLIAIGERESRPAIRAAIAAWGLPRVRPPAAPRATLPPLRAAPRWVDGAGAPAARAGRARALFGHVPAGPLTAAALEPGLARVYRGDLFESAWPTFRAAGDSTEMTVEVRDQDPAQLGLAFAYDSDEFARGNLTIAGRPVRRGWPGYVRVGLTARRYGGQIDGSVEPHALHRGAAGWFLRGALRRDDTRRFLGAHELGRVRTDRAELMAGRQATLPTGDVLQAGVGLARVRSPLADETGPIAALATEASGRLARSLQATAVGGARRYATLAARVAGDLPLGPLHLRPAVAAAWASPGTPPAELPGAGGPGPASDAGAPFPGLRAREWLGRSLAWGELRLTRTLYSVIEAHVAAGAARVRQPWSRAELDERFRFAGGAGVRANLPFGPLEVSWGVTGGGVHRIGMGIGQRF
jgi:predicted acylesterase/phospholipase RssA